MYLLQEARYQALSDEHIVPYSIGGQHVIDDASCDDCADVTKKFEQDVARQMWGDARVSYGSPTRRKKERREKTHIVLHDPRGIASPIKLPYSDYPAPTMFYQMNQAGLLQGAPQDLDISSLWQLTTVTDEKKLQAFEKKYPGRLVAKLRHVPESFARMIAKIGYGHTLCTLNPGDFRPICLSYIMGETKNVSFVVGGQFDIDPPDEAQGYVLRTAVFGSLEQIMLIAEVRLVANAHTPKYHVVVGDVIGRERVARVLQRIGSVEIRPPGSTRPLPPLASDDGHCMPLIWPLPFWTA